MHMRRMMNVGVAVALLSAAGCTTAELEAISQGLAQASYDMQQTNYQYGSYYGSPYQSPYQINNTTDLRTGYNQCVYSGTLYRCDTNGDGYADMFGNAEDGSMTSSTLKVNGRGEGFTWDSDCGCWQRDRAYDTARRDDYRDRKDRHDGGRRHGRD